MRVCECVTLTQWARALQACAGTRDEWAVYLKEYFGLNWLTDTTRDCGLPASTVKLSPALTTCEGAYYKMYNF